MSLDLIARVHKEDRRLDRLRRAKTDLWFLLTEILKRQWNPAVGGEESPFPGKGLTEELHKQLCAWIDKRRNVLNTAIFAPRWHHKTELAIGEIIQEILIDPSVTLGYFHAVDQQASMLVAEVGNHLQHTAELRKLEPIGMDEEGRPYNVLPARNAKKFITADQLTVRRHRFSRFPTLFGRGSGAEIAGIHMRKAWLDDIIGLRTIENSELPKISTWFESNLMPVVDDGMIRVRATRWHPDAIYERWIEAKEWHTIVLPAAVPPEFDFMEKPEVIDWSKDKIEVPKDYKLQSALPIYGPRSYRETQRKKLIYFEQNMKGNFPSQMMNDPTPESEKPWDRQAEHIVEKAYIKTSAWTFWVIHDPAPAKIGSMDFMGAKLRADGSKDFWAIACFGTRKRGSRMEICLVELDQSRQWTIDDGLRRGCQMQRRWGARRVGIESVGMSTNVYEGTPEHPGRMRIIAREEGVKYTPVDLRSSLKGKNTRFGALCSRAKADEFLICQETINPEMLEKFLHQAREWRPLPTGRNSLKYDDLADVVSYCADPAIDVYEVDEEVPQWGPYHQPEQETERGTLHVRW